MPRWYQAPSGRSAERSAPARRSRPERSGKAACGRHGWYGQQILKLLISRHVATERYLILDAKNLLVFPLRHHHLENGNKIVSVQHLYLKDNALRGYLQNVERYFNIELNGLLPPSHTPFVFPTELVIQMVQWIEQKEGDFAEFFMQHGMVEFLMFSAYLISTGQLDVPYDFSGPTYTTVWEHWATDEARIENKIAICERDKEPFFSVHRRAWPCLSAKSYRMITHFWQRRGLI